MSVDAKISTGDTDVMDIDSDFPKITGVKEGLKQYYDIEKTTDLFSLISGKVLVKIGANQKSYEGKQIPVTIVVIDNKPHLNENGIKYVASKFSKLIIITTHTIHPAVALKDSYSNIEVISYDKKIDFGNLFTRLKKEFGAERLTIQSGGELNALFVREGLVDRVIVVVAPCLVGGKNTPSLVGGESLHAPQDLSKIKSLELVQAKPLENSYLLLEYKVKNAT